jgi:chorismate dehydratase
MPRNTRIGVVSYLNAMPLWISMQHDESIELIPDTPARLADMMKAHQLDVGLLPVVEALREPGLGFYSDLGIAADGMVDSVGLFTRVDLPEVRTVALSNASRTSAALARVVLKAAGSAAAFTDVQVDADSLASRDEDAVLMIGDQCLRARKLEKDRVFVDLAAEWKLLTGLPFVFALWAGPRRALTPELHARLRVAYEESRAAASDAIRFAGMDTGWSEAELSHYLNEIIIHELTPDCIKGLLEFARRAAELELVPRAAVDKVLDAMRG